MVVGERRAEKQIVAGQMVREKVDSYSLTMLLLSSVVGPDSKW